MIYSNVPAINCPTQPKSNIKKLKNSSSFLFTLQSLKPIKIKAIAKQKAPNGIEFPYLSSLSTSKE